MADLPVVARLYTGGGGNRVYRRASVLPGPGEALVRKADAEAALSHVVGLLARYVKGDEISGKTDNQLYNAAKRVTDGVADRVPEQEESHLRWCKHCGEGVMDFCRGKVNPCPNGLLQPGTAGVKTPDGEQR